ncbi:hypothetical protein D3C85_1031620 [compost metagenome]
MIPTGTLIRKIQCHDSVCVSQPPSVGPISGPIMPGMATKLSAWRYCSRGKVRSTESRPTGSSMAPPTPCTTRAAVSTGSVGAQAHSSEPSTNRPMAVWKMVRVPKRSASQPEAGMTTAMVRE